MADSLLQLSRSCPATTVPDTQAMEKKKAGAISEANGYKEENTPQLTHTQTHACLLANSLNTMFTLLYRAC